VASRLGGGAASPAQAQAEQPAEPPPAEQTKTDQYYGYYDLDPITVNLNEPRLTRYIRATLTLVSYKKDYEQMVATIKEKLPEIQSFLIVYLSDCTFEEVRGAENLNRIRREIQDSLNNRLWPKGRPLIQRVDYKEWAVQ